MNRITSKIFLFLLNSLSGLSWKNAFRLSSVLKWLLFDVVGYRKDVIRTNLENSFPEKTAAEREIIANNFYLHFTDLIVETIKFRTASPEVVRERIQGDISMMDDFYASKLGTARFYFARLLPRIHSLDASVRAGSESLYLLEASQF